MAISVSGKEWKFPPDIRVAADLIEAAGGSELLAKLLARRGICTAQAARVFMDPALYNPMSPLALPDMQPAVERINTAIERQEKITIYGDYDVDGITGTSVLLTVFKKLGASVDYYIPNRAGEGYGLNLKAISVLASKHRTKLIVTCDCGVANFAEINFARSLGVDTIVTDHHTMSEVLPPAVAILHPKRLPEDHPLFDLPGVGVAYKLCEALFIDRGMTEQSASLLDFVTLGMIADMVPLVRENRYLVQMGLPLLAASTRPGIRALLAQVKSGGGTDLVGFGLAPRINAVGRLSDANLAVELMTTDDDQLAHKLAQQLQSDNARRQELCEMIMQEAEHMVTSKIDLTKNKAIAIFDEGWHHGVVGIVASRLVEKYHCPVFIGELDREEGTVRGSARSITGLDLYQALKANQNLLVKWGGHKMAAGFSVEMDKAAAFCQAITETCTRMLSERDSAPALHIDLLVNPQAVTPNLVHLINKLSPFGMDNRKPVLVMQDLLCTESRAIGKEGKHSRIMIKDNSGQLAFECVLWNSKGKVPPEGKSLDVAFNPEMNSFNGRERLQLVLLDWHGAHPITGREESIPVARLAKTTDAADPSGSPNGIPEDRGEVASDATKPGSPSASATEPHPETTATRSLNLNWKDLRDHSQPESLLDSATRKLGETAAIFGEGLPKIAGVEFVDRMTVDKHAHLLLWQFPPTLQCFQTLLSKSQARHIYLMGHGESNPPDPQLTLKRLTGLARFAVNQKEGRVEGERLAAALATSKMVIALGLVILRKLNLLDWFAEDGWINLEMLDQPTGRAEDLQEFRQLSDSLNQVSEFRRWCREETLKTIQLAVVPNQICLSGSGSGGRDVDKSHSRDQETELRASTYS